MSYSLFPESGRHICVICKEELDSFVDLEKHMNTHKVCFICRRVIKDVEELIDHIIKTHGECIICGEILENKSALPRHYNIHLETSCYQCGRTFDKTADVVSHVRKMHKSFERRIREKFQGIESNTEQTEGFDSRFDPILAAAEGPVWEQQDDDCWQSEYSQPKTAVKYSLKGVKSKLKPKVMNVPWRSKSENEIHYNLLHQDNGNKRNSETRSRYTVGKSRNMMVQNSQVVGGQRHNNMVILELGTTEQEQQPSTSQNYINIAPVDYGEDTLASSECVQEMKPIENIKEGLQKEIEETIMKIKPELNSDCFGPDAAGPSGSYNISPQEYGQTQTTVFSNKSSSQNKKVKAARILTKNYVPSSRNRYFANEKDDESKDIIQETEKVLRQWLNQDDSSDSDEEMVKNSTTLFDEMIRKETMKDIPVPDDDGDDSEEAKNSSILFDEMLASQTCQQNIKIENMTEDSDVEIIKDSSKLFDEMLTKEKQRYANGTQSQDEAHGVNLSYQKDQDMVGTNPEMVQINNIDQEGKTDGQDGINVNFVLNLQSEERKISGGNVSSEVDSYQSSPSIADDTYSIGDKTEGHIRGIPPPSEYVAAGWVYTGCATSSTHLINRNESCDARDQYAIDCLVQSMSVQIHKLQLPDKVTWDEPYCNFHIIKGLKVNLNLRSIDKNGERLLSVKKTSPSILIRASSSESGSASEMSDEEKHGPEWKPSHHNVIYEKFGRGRPKRVAENPKTKMPLKRKRNTLYPFFKQYVIPVKREELNKSKGSAMETRKYEAAVTLLRQYEEGLKDDINFRALFTSQVNEVYRHFMGQSDLDVTVMNLGMTSYCDDEGIAREATLVEFQIEHSVRHMCPSRFIKLKDFTNILYEELKTGSLGSLDASVDNFCFNTTSIPISNYEIADSGNKRFYQQPPIPGRRGKGKTPCYSQADNNQLLSPMRCDICRRRFPDIATLEKHRAFHPICRVCGETKLDIAEVSRHIAHTHPECLVCGELIHDFGIVEEHYKQHEKLDCQHCKEVFKDYPALREHNVQKHIYFIVTKQHVMTSAKRETLAYVCKECMQVTVLQHKGFTVKDHKHNCGVAFVSPRISHVPICDVCFQKFSSEKELSLHVRTHPICHVCRKMAKTEELLLKHLRTRHAVCQVCGFVAQTQIDLFRDHYREHDDKKCPHCHGYFENIRQLIDHCYAAHRSWWCKRCNLFFDSNSAFKRHEKIHNYDTVEAGKKSEQENQEEEEDEDEEPVVRSLPLGAFEIGRSVKTQKSASTSVQSNNKQGNSFTDKSRLVTSQRPVRRLVVSGNTRSSNQQRESRQSSQESLEMRDQEASQGTNMDTQTPQQSQVHFPNLQTLIKQEPDNTNMIKIEPSFM